MSGKRLFGKLKISFVFWIVGPGSRKATWRQFLGFCTNILKTGYGNILCISGTRLVSPSVPTLISHESKIVRFFVDKNGSEWPRQSAFPRRHAALKAHVNRLVITRTEERDVLA